MRRRGWLDALPRPCALCNQWDRTALCSECRLRFVDNVLPRCPRCALPAPGGQVCGGCLTAPPPFAQAVAVADYAFPWDRLIARFKFRQQPELAALLADALAAAVRRAGGEPFMPPALLVLPVPLSPARLAERGYNQAWELARRVAAVQGLPARHDLLLRLRDTPHQVGLDRHQRAANLRDTMWVPRAGRAVIAGRPVALVDDVMTTGITAAAATRALLAAGAAGVRVWVLARTRAPPG